MMIFNLASLFLSANFNKKKTTTNQKPKPKPPKRCTGDKIIVGLSVHVEIWTKNAASQATSGKVLLSWKMNSALTLILLYTPIKQVIELHRLYIVRTDRYYRKYSAFFFFTLMSENFKLESIFDALNHENMDEPL